MGGKTSKRWDPPIFSPTGGGGLVSALPIAQLFEARSRDAGAHAGYLSTCRVHGVVGCCKAGRAAGGVVRECVGCVRDAGHCRWDAMASRCGWRRRHAEGSPRASSVISPEGTRSLVGPASLSSPSGPCRRMVGRPAHPYTHPRAVNVCSRSTIPPACCNAGQSGACHICPIGVPDRSPARVWPRYGKGSSVVVVETNQHHQHPRLPA